MTVVTKKCYFSNTSEFYNLKFYFYSRKCRLCGNDVGEKPAMRAHLRTNHPQEPFVCDYCETMFFNDLDFYQHVKEHVVYNPMESLEEVPEQNNVEENEPKPNTSSALVTRQRKRGVYRKRVKVEIPAPEETEGELPRIGKKEGGLCPHCGEVRYRLSFIFGYFRNNRCPLFCWKL